MGHYVARLLADCGIEDADLHSQRHTHSTALQNRGVDSEVIRQRQGHTRIETTRGYIHATIAAQRQAVAALEDLLR